MIPIGIIKFHHANATLNHTAGQQAVVGKRRGTRLGPIGRQCCGGFAGNIHQIGNRSLHAERHLILADACGNFRVTRCGQSAGIQLVDGLKNLGSVFASLPLRVGQKQHRVTRGSKLNSLVHTRQKPTAPQRGASTAQRTRKQHHIGGQVFGFRSQAIVQPGTNRRPATPAKAGMQKHLCRGMIDLLGVNGFHNRNLIRHGAKVRQQVGKFLARATFFLELKPAACQRHLATNEGKSPAFQQGFRAFLAIPFHKLWLVFKQIQMRRCSNHVQINNAFCLGDEMRLGCCGSGVGRFIG